MIRWISTTTKIYWRTFLKELHGECNILDISVDPTAHNALGIHWDTEQDTLHVSVPTISTDIIPTKRLVVSVAAKVFDLIGWFGPLFISFYKYCGNSNWTGILLF